MSIIAGTAIESALGGYKIERSLRFNSADSAYLSRTPGSSGNKKTFTVSFWIKRSGLSATNALLDGDSSDGNRGEIYFDSSDKLNIYDFYAASGGLQISSARVFRDVGAWMHIVIAFDTTQATDSNRLKIYVNGVQENLASYSVGSGASRYPALNADFSWNGTTTHWIGHCNSGSSAYSNQYLTEFYNVDGQQLDPTSFGEYNVDTGVWQPIAYSGSYGTNGFYLNFSDNSGTTSTTLGKDYSGNGNNWTPNNFSVTAGAGNDSMVDVPTPWGTDTGAGGEVRGNYATLNPLSTTAGTYTQGNLRYVGASAWRRSNATLAVSTGKWYWEVTLGNAPYSPRGTTSSYNAFGFGLSTVFNSTTPSSSVTDAIILADNGYYKNFSGSWTDGGTAFSSGDTLAVAVNLDANTFTFYRNNTQITTGTIGGTAGRELVPIILSYDGSYGVMDCNFGQRPFAYTAPSGFAALCTTNLSDPAIADGSQYFDVDLWTGNGTGQSITTPFAPDFVWIKARNQTYDNQVWDRLRGPLIKLATNQTAAESSLANSVTSFNSNGYTLGDTATVNLNTGSFVGWAWKAGGTGVSNTAGTITSTVSANTTAGFSIVTYTGNNTANQTVGHGIGVAPSMIIVKNRTSSATSWAVYHVSVGVGKYLELNKTDTPTTNSAFFDQVTSTVFGFDAGGSFINASGDNYVAYCFAPVAGYSAFGSYTGNGSSDGPFVFCGFRPAFVMVKVSSGSVRGWSMWDDRRSIANGDSFNYRLEANSSAAEDSGSGGGPIDMLSNGFKIRNTAIFDNESSSTFIYAAFAENPFKYALAR